MSGSSLPLVSWASGSSARPRRKATEVHATGVPMVSMRGDAGADQEGHGRRDEAAEEVAKAKALPRHSVRYCSGSHSVYTEKFAPPTPRKKRQTRNQNSALSPM